MKISKILFGAIILSAISVQAHFQVLLPSSSVIENLSKPLNLEILFTHPMENGPAMEMKKPVKFGVMEGDKKTSLLKSLQPVKVDGKQAYKSSFSFKKPGDYIFYLEPAPYWEPAEQKMIIHYTKVILDVLAAGEGWDEMVGFPVEIEPLVRPYDIYTGNVFRGIVKKDGKPVPFAEVEVEYYNKDKRFEVPADIYTTQVIKADANGTFSYAFPVAGWWGFAALIDGPQMENPEGKMVDVELGALIWVKTVDMKAKK
jgi:cobalt/nickel transport protein